MAKTTEKAKRSHERRSRGRQRPRSRRRARARRRGSRRMQREFREAGTELRQVRSDVRRATTNVREAGENVLQAGEAGLSVAREVAGAATDRVGQVATRAQRRAGDATEAARERLEDVAVEAGRTAFAVGAQIMSVPEIVRESARRGVELVETAGTRAVVGVIQAGTRVLSAAADYVGELAPRRRVQRNALEQLVVEMLSWAHAGTEAYDRTIDETDDGELRTRLARFKLQTIKQGEALTELMRQIGGTVPAEERESPPPTVPADDGRQPRGPTASRQGLALALTIAVQSAEGWRALNRIAAWAEQDRVADAIVRAAESVGAEAEQQVDALRDAVLDQTLEAVLA